MSGAKPGSEGQDARELPELTVSEAVGPGSATLAGLLGERYRTVARLGSGAFGDVYRAHDGVLGRDVAIKRIRLESFVEPAQLEEVKQRFQREAQVAARLRHPNIVTTHDIVSSPASSFIVMELVEGRTLQSLLAERRRLPLDEAARLLGQVAAALDHAHASGVVHRDVKPANVMVEPSGPGQGDGLRHREGRGRREPDRDRPDHGDARTTCRPSRRAAGRSTPAPTCSRSAASSTSASPE